MPAALMAPRPCALAMRTSTGSDVWMRSAKTASDSMSSARSFVQSGVFAYSAKSRRVLPLSSVAMQRGVITRRSLQDRPTDRPFRQVIAQTDRIRLLAGSSRAQQRVYAVPHVDLSHGLRLAAAQVREIDELIFSIGCTAQMRSPLEVRGRSLELCCRARDHLPRTTATP